MSFHRSKGFWILFVIIIISLLLIANYGIKVMTSTFKTDMGNGVIIYADNYVETGNWVFDCKYSRLISRQPLPTPIAELERTNTLTTGQMYTLNDTEKRTAEILIRDLIAKPNWYKDFKYTYSSLDENSDLNSHVFNSIKNNRDQQWIITIRQNIDYSGNSNFKITAEPYNHATYVDHSKALQNAAKSCPIPQ